MSDEIEPDTLNQVYTLTCYTVLHSFKIVYYSSKKNCVILIPRFKIKINFSHCEESVLTS